MTLGDIFKQAVQKDLAAIKPGTLVYTEDVKAGKFTIRLSSTEDKEAYITCELPEEGTPDQQNYLRLYFLSMVFHAGVYGMKRQKSKKIK